MRIRLDLPSKLEKHLIQLGLQTLIEQTTGKQQQAAKARAHRWTPKQRAKLSAAMAATWEEKTGAAKKPPRAKKHRTNGAALRRDGKPLVHPGKRWTAEHRARFVATMKRLRAEGKIGQPGRKRKATPGA